MPASSFAAASSAAFPAENPIAMQQDPPRLGAASGTSASSSRSTLYSSSAGGSYVNNTKHSRHTRSEGGGGGSLSFFSKLIGGVGSSSAHALSSYNISRPIARQDSFEWKCAGEESGDLLYEVDLEQREQPSRLPTPEFALRPPSLTHSRASSADSAVSTTSSMLSFENKPLPALPLIATPEVKARPFTAHVLEQIDELSIVSMSRENSIDSPAHLHFHHLDLAVPSFAEPASPSHLSSSSSMTSTLTPRRALSSITSSPLSAWTPRHSSCHTPHSEEGAFALELSLERQELLTDIDKSILDSPTPSRTALPIAERAGHPLVNEIVGDDSEEDLSMMGNQIIDITLSEPVPADGGSMAMEGSDEGTEIPSSPSMQEGFVSAQTDDEEEAGSSKPPSFVRRQTIPVNATVRISRQGGWRGWRNGSQPSTPVGEEPPILTVQAQTPAASASATKSVKDYFGDFLSQTLGSIAESSPAKPTPKFHLHLPLQPESPSTSVLPKLSPDFQFGRRTPSPSGRSASVDLTPESDVDSIRSLPRSSVPLPQRRLRSASADQLGLRAQQSQPNMRSTAKSVAFAALAAAKEASTGHNTATAQGIRDRYRIRMSARRVGSSTSNGPKYLTQSFDAEELSLLRNSAAGPTYSWI